MKRRIAFRTTTRKTSLTLALTCCVLALAACKDDATASSGPNIHEANYSGVLTTSLGDYTFTPTVCTLFREGDVDDIEIHGPGTAPDGEVFFLELSSIAEALSVHLGVDKPMTHSDRVLQAGRWNSEPFTIERTGDSRTFKVRDILLVDWNQNPIEGRASLDIDCTH